VVSEGELRERVEAWVADDPDPGDRAELRGLADRAFGGADATALAELRDRFAARLEFGTAGLRGVVAAGPNRMNRAVVRAATAAVAGWLLDPGPDGAPGRESTAGGVGGSAGAGGDSAAAIGGGPAGAGVSVVVGCDARHRSAEFAAEAAGVLAGAGIAVHVLPQPGPTPLLAFAVRHLGTSAGVMITASHNPAADNGYKLYLSDGGQVIPPADAQIEARIAALGPLAQVPVAAADSPLITRHGDEVARAAYLDAVVATSAGPGSGSDRAKLTVVYTAMHGVAGDLMLRAIDQAGFAPPHVVAAQARPDPDFPTVAFPNPEEPGALDLALADARRFGADLLIASDPDGDRLAVAVSRPGGQQAGEPDWLVLTGDQLGAVLGASLLERTAGQAAPGDRLVATTIVSSTLLSKIAASAGVRYAETLTGFKWISRAADRVPGARFLFGYEEALGYDVGNVVRDKDGIGAALAMLWLAGEAKAAGRSVLQRYDDLEAAHGVHLTSQVTLRTADQAEVMRRLRAHPPAALGDEPVTGLTDLAAGNGGAAGAALDGGAGTATGGGATGGGATGGGATGGGATGGGATGGGATAPGDGLPRADVLVLRLVNARVVLRPSGTEPKIKCYIEIIEPLAGRPLPAVRWTAAKRLAPIRSALEAVLAAS
jgi:phosphomannomutase